MRIEDVMPSTSPDERAEDQNVPPGMQEAQPQEQEAYEKVVLAGMKILYDDKTRDKVLAMVKQSKDDPARAMAMAAQTLILQMDEQSGGTIPQEIILPAAAEILEHLAELVNESGLAQVDETVLGDAGQQLLMGLAQAYDVSPEEVQELLASVPPEQVEGMVQQQSGYAAARQQREQQAMGGA